MLRTTRSKFDHIAIAVLYPKPWARGIRSRSLMELQGCLLASVLTAPISAAGMPQMVVFMSKRAAVRRPNRLAID